MRNILLTALACTPLLALGFPLAFDPQVWGGSDSAWKMKRHEQKMAVVTNGGAQVVFLGDSITHNWENAGKEQLARYFSSGASKVLDLGTGGDRTHHVLWRITEGRELDGYAAKVVFLMIGTNNASRNPPGDTILAIREILRVIREKQPQATVVLLPIFPRGQDWTDLRRQRNAIVNREIVRFADGRKILWCDFNEQFLTLDGRLSRELFPDLLHPNASGYEIWAAAIRPYIDAALSEGRLPMPPNRYAPFQRAETIQTTERLTVYPVSRIRREGYGEKDWWLDRFCAHRGEIAQSQGEIDLVFFGDSITHNWERRAPELLADLRKTYRVLNLGYSGDHTEHLLWRGENGELDDYRAKCVMLMIGTNNTWHSKDKPEDIAAGIRAVLDLIARKQPEAKTLLLPIFPIGDSPTEARRVNNEKVNALIRGFADGEKVIWVDFTKKFLDAKGDTKWIMPDRVHPSMEGYRDIWLPAVLPHFKSICGK